MSECPPLAADDALSTPSSLTSLASTPEPELTTLRNVAACDGGVKLNTFRTTNNACSSPGCPWPVDSTRPSELCFVCEQRKYHEMERERLRYTLNVHAKGALKPKCAICARTVVLPPVVHPAQFVICTVCEGRMLSMNAAYSSAKSSVRLPSSKPSQSASLPLSQPHTASQLRGQPHARLVELKVSSRHEGGQGDLPLTIKLPKLYGAATKPKEPAASRPVAGTAMAGREARKSAKHNNKGRERSQSGVAEVVPKHKANVKIQSASKPHPTVFTRPLSMFDMRSFPSALLLRWGETEKAIEALSKTPHFNDRGEYIVPPTPSPFKISKDAVSPHSNYSPLSSNAIEPSSPEEVPLSLRRQLMKARANVNMLPTPFTFQPLPHRSVTSTSIAGVSPPFTAADIFPESSNVANHGALERPRLTLRLPSRSPPNDPQVAPAPPAAHAATAFSPATTVLRSCRRQDCTVVLDPSHPWVFCTKCLSNKEPKTLSPSEPLRWTPVVETKDVSRRQSEPHVWEVQGWTGKTGDRSRRASEPSAVPAMGQRDGKREKTKTSGQSVLPTPPPSSRQSSPVTATRVSPNLSSPRATLPDIDKASIPLSPLSPSSSPELPLASISLLTPPTPHAPHYSRKEDNENLWESDLSELTPLESSDDNSNDSDAEPTQVMRGRSAAEKGGSYLPGPKGFVCVRSKCHNLLAACSKWKMCHTCRLRLRDRSRERRQGSPVFAHGDDANVGVDLERVCAIRTCKALLPPEALYRWKMCEACRTRTRRQSRKRRYGEVGLASDEDDEDLELPARPEHQKNKVPFKRLKLTFKGATIASVEAQRRARVATSVIVPDNVVRGPLYQTLPAMLDALRTRLLSFVTATTHYMQFKVRQLAQVPSPGAALVDAQPAFFSFDGEFSIIADPAGGEVASRIQLVQEEAGRTLGIVFELAGYDIRPDGAIIGQYACEHEVLLPLPLMRKDVPAPATSPDVALEVEKFKNDVAAKRGPVDGSQADDQVFDVFAKRMQGELRISILWDRSHKYFPGLRTVVQFKLMG